MAIMLISIWCLAVIKCTSCVYYGTDQSQNKWQISDQSWLLKRFQSPFKRKPCLLRRREPAVKRRQGLRVPPDLEGPVCPRPGLVTGSLFLFVCCCKKTLQYVIDLLGGVRIQWPLIGEIPLYLVSLSATPLAQTHTLEGLFRWNGNGAALHWLSTSHRIYCFRN